MLTVRKTPLNTSSYGDGNGVGKRLSMAASMDYVDDVHSGFFSTGANGIDLQHSRAHSRHVLSRIYAAFTVKEP